MRRRSRALRRLLAWLATLVAACVLTLAAVIVAYRFVRPPLTPLMVVRVLEGLPAGRWVGVTKRWVDVERVSPTLVRAVIGAEDTRFFVHHGVDLDALRRAATYNARHGGRRLRGAGTITMQCARNVFLWQGRSYLRKGLEISLSPVLELAWGKRRILEVYLNVIEWGDGLYGVEAAAERYFGTTAARLDAWQSALLAAALPDPRRSNPAAPSRYLAARAAIIMARAGRVRLGALTAADGIAARRGRR